MTARPAPNPSSAAASRIPTGAPILAYVSAGTDRRSLILVTSGHYRPLAVAVEPDGSLSKRLFASDPALPGKPELADAPDVSAKSLKALGSDTIQLAHALRARQAALEGGEHLVDRFCLGGARPARRTVGGSGLHRASGGLDRTAEGRPGAARACCESAGQSHSLMAATSTVAS